MSRRSPSFRRTLDPVRSLRLGSPSECSPVALVGNPTSSRGIRPDMPTFALTARAMRWTLQTLRPAWPREARVSRHPSTDIPSERPLPRIDIAADPVRSRGCQPRNPVSPSWFRTTSATSSAREVAGLLHPAASHGVRRVSCHRVPVRPGFLANQASGPSECRCIPRDAFHTPRRIPPDRSRTPSLGPLPPCRSPPSSSAARGASVAGDDLYHSARGPGCIVDARSTRSALSSAAPRRFSAVGSVTPPRPLPAVGRPILPWALFPFEVLRRLRAHPCARCRRRARTGSEEP